MPEFRVIGGPHDGLKWHLNCFDDGERVYIPLLPAKNIEHVYVLALNGLTATHIGWRPAVVHQERYDG